MSGLSEGQAVDILDSFDLVAVQDWTGYKSRQEPLRQELARLGLLSRAKWFWRTPSPFTPLLAHGLRSTRYSLGGFDCTMGHYEIMKLALAWGCRRVLIMEDDACFADASVVRSALSVVPDDWQFLKLEWYERGGRAFPGGTGGAAWSRFSSDTVTGVLCGTGAVAFTAEGLKWKTGLIEDCLQPFGVPMHTIDMYDTPEFVDRTVAYCATPCLAVQRPHGRGDPHNHAGTKPYRREFLVGGSMSAGYPSLRGLHK